MVVQLSVSTN